MQARRLSLEKHVKLEEPTRSSTAEGPGEGDTRNAPNLLPGSESLACMHLSSAREPGDLGVASPLMVDGRQEWEGEKPQATTVSSEESDEPIVPEKQPNTEVTPVEEVEGRGEANGKSETGNAAGTRRPETRGHVTTRIGERARRIKGERFTNLFSHLRIDLLREAYYRLKKQAAPGVDGETWSSYGNGLEERLRDLEERLHRGRYRPQPVRRVHIPKGDGRTRPLGIPSLEDKVVQQAARMLLEPIYENSGFLDISYGFRPGRSPHRALDALKEALKGRVDWVLDADIRSFFDTIDHKWMQKFIEHRIADKRMVYLLMKWMQAGVMDEGQYQDVEAGTPQGGIISPLLANIYLHYALDLWVKKWSRMHADGEVHIVRYADDFVMGFQKERDARRMRDALAERLRKFGLELHPEKTRILRFGRFAQRDCHKDGKLRPDTFDFLGFTHICGQGLEGGYRVIRRTSKKKMQKKMASLSEEIRKRKHEPMCVQCDWLSSVLQGHYNYYGVPGNFPALQTFRQKVRRTWHAALQRRSQRAKWNAQRRDIYDRNFKLPTPRITQRTSRQLSLPSTRGGSPVREIRSSGYGARSITGLM